MEGLGSGRRRAWHTVGSGEQPGGLGLVLCPCSGITAGNVLVQSSFRGAP